VQQPDMVTEISGTDIRTILSQGGQARPEIMRPEIVAALDGIPLFIDREEP
jgi:ATP sulfurylase